MQNHTLQCPVTTALSVIGGKWKVIILWHLKEGGVKRFGELQRLVRGISQKMLTQELRDLEESGLVSRKVYPVVPPKVEYCADGNRLVPEARARAIERLGQGLPQEPRRSRAGDERGGEFPASFPPARNRSRQGKPPT